MISMGIFPLGNEAAEEEPLAGDGEVSPPISDDRTAFTSPENSSGVLSPGRNSFMTNEIGYWDTSKTADR